MSLSKGSIFAYKTRLSVIFNRPRGEMKAHGGGGGVAADARHIYEISIFEIVCFKRQTVFLI